jgi:hypothetical protein
MKLPQPWATSANYASGPDVGTPTKVDPASAVNGFVRGAAAAAQHVNFNLHPLAETTRRTFTTGCLALRLLDALDQDDLTAGLAVDASAITSRALLIKASTTGVTAVHSGASGAAVGVLSGITDSLRQAARVSTTVVAIGAGGTQNARSGNTGNTWTTGGASGLIGDLVSVAADGTQFCVATAAGGSAHGTGATWTVGTIGDDISDVVTGGGITSVAGITGLFVAVGVEAGSTAFARSVDHGVLWTAASGTVPNAATHTDAGWITSDGTSAFYHAGYLNNVADVGTAADGNTWTALAQFTTAAITGIKIMRCRQTDLLVVAMQHGDLNVEVRASTDGGASWSEPEYLQGFVLAGLGVANGRLFGARGAKLYASDGVGSE